jgi:hypothetical protein
MKLSKRQWDFIGQQAGWHKVSQNNSKRELRLIDNINSKAETVLDHPIIFTGTMEELRNYASQKGLTWKSKPDEMFGGYWVDDASGESYIIT